jgi:tetratricopeptide (TPR) repeat protein
MAFEKLKASLYTIKANITFNKGDARGSLDWLEKAYSTGMAKTEIVNTYAYLLLKSGDLDKSVSLFAELLSTPNLSDKNRLQIKSSYALALWKKGDLDSAIKMLEDVIQNYKTTNIYGSLGYLYILKGDLEKALKFNLEAYDYNNAGVILDNLGQTYYMMGDYPKSEEIYKILIASKPTFPEAYYDYALLLEKLDRKDEAIQNIKKALEYRTSYLSDVTKEQIEEKLASLSAE